MKIYIYVVTDTHGNKVEGVVGESSDTLFLPGLKDTSGESQTFESESYHVLSWAESFGFSMTMHSIDLDLNKMVLAEWNIEGNNYSF